MDNDQLHRIEHKLDEILEHLRIKEDVIPKMPSDKRLCPVCTEEIKFAPTVFVNQKGEVQTGVSRRICACKIYPTLKGE